MKITIFTLVIAILFSYAPTAIAYRLSYSTSGAEVQWAHGEIDIHLDPSLGHFSEGAFQIVEDSLLTWIDYVDTDILINFVYAPCEEGISCVSYIDRPDGSGAASTHMAWSVNSGDMIYANITFNKTLKGYDFAYAALHEAGHFWGLSHSDNHSAVMDDTLTRTTVLHEDDINGVKTLYGDEVYPSIAPEPIDYHFVGCSVAEPAEGSSSILSLIF